jgi:NDP-sugar pyrophosphorylase family protein
MKKEMEAIVLAGGYGSRMERYTRERQKCLLPVDGKPVLGHILEALVHAFGSVDVKIGVAYKSDQVVDWVNNNKPRKVSVTYVPHVPGTEGWGIYREMREHVEGPFVAMPGDIVALPDAFEQAALQFAENDVEASMTLSPALDTVDTHGVGRIENGQVVELQWPPAPDPDPGYQRDMTIWSSDKRFFELIEKYPSRGKSIGHVFMGAVRDRLPIAGNSYDLPWIHLGYEEDLKKSMQGNTGIAV